MLFTQEALNKIPYLEDYVAWLFKKIWFDFKVNNKELFLTAFIHKSYACDYVWKYAHNERLEFLWDWILWAVINKKLFLDFVDEDESRLTLLKVNLVREETLAEVAREINLWEYVFIWKWEKKQWGKNKDSILSDSLESLIWYLYLDQVIDYVDAFVINYVYNSQIDKIKNKKNKSFKTQLQEFVQKQIHKIPVYNTKQDWIDLETKLPKYRAIVDYQDLQGIGFWKNKKIAEENAAKDLLDKINKNLNSNKKW